MGGEEDDDDDDGGGGDGVDEGDDDGGDGGSPAAEASIAVVSAPSDDMRMHVFRHIFSPRGAIGEGGWTAFTVFFLSVIFFCVVRGGSFFLRKLGFSAGAAGDREGRTPFCE